MKQRALIQSSGGGGTPQAKTHIVPKTTSQTVVPDPGYDCLSSVQIDGITYLEEPNLYGITATIGNGEYVPPVSNTLSGLDDVNISEPTVDEVLKYNGNGWINGPAPASGHTMIPVSGDMEAITALNNGNDNYVINAYSAKRWSNCDAKIVLTTANQGDTGIGAWNDTWKTDNVRTGWLWSADFYRILEDENGNTVNDIEVIPVFDVGQNETVSLCAFRIDDNVSNDGVNGGAVAFKFNGAIRSANGIKVGLKLVHQRTEVNDTGTRLS